MILRRLTAKDEEAAMALLEAQYREHAIAMKGAPLRRALRRLLKGRGVAFVALDPAPAGIAVLAWAFSLERAGEQAWLEELYVVPQRRGEGIGRALLLRSIAAAKARGCVSLELEVVRGHERAARLYVREGFGKLARARYSRRL